MHFLKTDLSGVLALQPEKFIDHRGSYLEIYDREKYKDFLDVEFLQDDVSVSSRHVLRGIHGDYRTAKLVTVLSGTGYALIVDNREESSTYRKWQSFTLSQENNTQLFLPPGIGNSILSMTDNLIYFYKQSTSFLPEKQFTIKWDDPSYGFWWPIENPILSRRDFCGEYK
jgi:dTDP-4-dehydrorhamnose 3,5-epimerase